MKAIFTSLLLLSVFVSWSAEAQTFRCGGKIVSTGDTKVDVIGKCGEPTSKDSREDKVVTTRNDDTMQKVSVIVDEWTYNLGPNELIRVLRFRDGKLTDIETAGYGYSNQKPVFQCDGAFPSIGSTKSEVFSRCGEPTLKEERNEKTVAGADKGSKREIATVVEQWTYNLGPRKFMRIFTFKNGKITDIKTGGYGY